LPTVTGAHRGEQAMVAAYFEQANGGFYEGRGSRGRRADVDDHRERAATSSS
jgi:DNA (cytosine-5)-methyltransferase 1